MNNNIALDDGSTDGTFELLKLYNVNTYKSDGSNFWAGGMRKLLNKLELRSYDFVLCVNDDIILEKKAFLILLKYIKKYFSTIDQQIFVGSCYDKLDIKYGSVFLKKTFYGYSLKLSKSKNTFANTFNMNFTMISTKTIEEYGFLDEVYTHHWADFDYGLRMTSLGVKIIQIHDHICQCKRNMKEAASFNKSFSFLKRFKLLISKKEQHPVERLIFYKRHGGKLWMLGFLSAYFLFFIPVLRSYFKKLK